MRHRVVLLILLVAGALAWPPIPVTNSQVESARETTARRPVWPSLDEQRPDPPAVVLDAEALRREFGGEVAAVAGDKLQDESVPRFTRNRTETLAASPAHDPWDTDSQHQPFQLASKVDVETRIDGQSESDSASIAGELIELPPASETSLPEIADPLPPLHPGRGYLELPAPPR